MALKFKKQAAKADSKPVKVEMSVLPAEKPATVEKPAKVTKPADSAVSSATAVEVTMTFPVVHEAPVFIDVTHDGKRISISKTSVVSWSIADGVLSCTMSKAYAKRRGFV